MPDFYHWFKERRSEKFIECLILSARERHGISGRFTTNDLELKNRLQEKMIAEEKGTKKNCRSFKHLKNLDTVMIF